MTRTTGGTSTSAGLGICNLRQDTSRQANAAGGIIRSGFTIPCRGLEVHREANRRQRVNLEHRNIMVDLGDFGLHIGLHGRIASGVHADHCGIAAGSPRQRQRRLWRTRISHTDLRAETEATPVTRNQIAEADENGWRNLVEAELGRARNWIRRTTDIARAAQREHLAARNRRGRADMVVVIKQESGTDVERARKWEEIEMRLPGSEGELAAIADAVFIESVAVVEEIESSADVDALRKRNRGFSANPKQ